MGTRHAEDKAMLRFAFVLLAAAASQACAPTTDPAPATPAPTARVDSPTPEAQDRMPTCASPPIYRDRGLRDGLPAGSSECRAALQSTNDELAKSRTCSADSDCVIQPLAGGCMGAGLVRDAGAASLPEPCIPDACRDADFSDHKVRCEAGCCVVFES